MDRIEEIRKKIKGAPFYVTTTEEIGFLFSHISSLEKRVDMMREHENNLQFLINRKNEQIEAQRKVVVAAKEAVKWELPDFNSLEDLRDALREVGE